MDKKFKTALIVIDLQEEYTNGKLEIPYSSNIVNKVNSIQNKFDIVCFVKNIFPKREVSKKGKITISDTGHYCVDGTDGVEFSKDLKTNDNIFIRNYDDSFSVFNSKNGEVILTDFLKENGITHLFLSGLPGDYSIKYTALESIDKFKTYIIIDAVKTINKMNTFVNYIVSRKIPFIDTNDINIVLKGLVCEPGDIKEIKKDGSNYTKKKERSKYDNYRDYGIPEF